VSGIGCWEPGAGPKAPRSGAHTLPHSHIHTFTHSHTRTLTHSASIVRPRFDTIDLDRYHENVEPARNPAGVGQSFHGVLCLMTPRERVDPMQVLKLVVVVAICAAMVAAALYSMPRVAGALTGVSAKAATKSPPPNFHGMPDYNAHPGDALVEFDDLVRKTKGDFSRLTPDQRSWVNGYTSGNGPRALEMEAARLLHKTKAHK